ncbi:hypothetical protein DQR70_05770 [Salmonella enterica subsp. enterica serovar Oslo]|nr:hypothetical protein [Salmonella enterica subsp. enterica serovar Oslo]EEX4841265.1 hypothetical protein [Escherichia coli]ELF5188667.1 hypothetical protein [Salmonella enterica]
MEKVYARELLHWDTRDLLTKEDCLEPILVEFDDEVIETTWQETIVSRLFWKFHIEYPDTPLNAHSHVQGEFLSPGLQKKLLERGKADVREAYPEVDDEDLNLIAYQITNDCHNMAVGDLEEYTGTMDALAFLQIKKDAEIQKIREEIYEDPSKRTVNKVYRNIRNILMYEPRYRNNPIAISLNQGTIKQGQLLQIIGFRGFCSEINQKIFKNIIPVGFMEGLTRLSFYGMESRSASTAMLSTDDPVKTTEYYNRELQLLNYGVTEIDFEDCGSDETMPWKVTESDLDEMLPGKFYVKGKELIMIRKRDRHLVGKTIELRVPAYCHHPDDGVICKYCLGEVAESFQRNGNAQYQATVSQNETVSQQTISVKHLLMSAESDSYRIDPYYAVYFDNSANDKEIILASDIWQKHDVKLIFNRYDIHRLADINQAERLDQEDTSSFSKLRTVTLSYRESKNKEPITQPVPLNHGSYAPFLTKEFLKYISDYGHEEVNGEIIVSLANWPDGEVIFRLPERRSSVLEAAVALKKEIFAIGDSGRDGKARLAMDLRDPMLLSKAIRDIAELTNSRFRVSLPIIELVMLAMMGRDPDNGDYRMPRKGTGARFATQRAIMNGRSLSGKAAYERQYEMAVDPASYLDIPRGDHPFDEFLVPIGRRSNQWRERPKGTYYGRVVRKS